MMPQEFFEKISFTFKIPFYIVNVVAIGINSNC